jgi:hypothetical protein
VQRAQPNGEARHDDLHPDPLMISRDRRDETLQLVVLCEILHSGSLLRRISPIFASPKVVDVMEKKCMSYDPQMEPTGIKSETDFIEVNKGRLHILVQRGLVSEECTSKCECSSKCDCSSHEE